jgi:uncharacterized protein (DUF2384 family)
MPNRPGQRSTALTIHRELVSTRDAFAPLRFEGVAWQDFGDIQRDLHLTNDELAGALGVGSDDLVARSGADDRAPSWSEEVVHRIAALASLHKHLLQTFTSSEAIPLWMRADSRYLGGRTPADVLRDGRIGRVESALEALDYGAFV